MNITSRNLKLVIGATYLIALFAVLYFVFSFIDVKDLANYEFIRVYKESIFQYKNKTGNRRRMGYREDNKIIQIKNIRSKYNN